MKLGFLISVSLLFFAAFVKAETRTTKIGSCEIAGETFSLLSESSSLKHAFDEGAIVTVFSSRIDPSTKLNYETQGVMHPSSKQIDLGTFWRPQSLSFSDCHFKSFLTATRDNDPEFETPMHILGYFISMWPIPDGMTIDDLIRQGEALPVEFDIVCTSSQEPTSPLVCDQVRFLQDIIPVKPSERTAMNTSSIVQVRSAFCAGSKTLISSGVVVSWQGQNYVLTSAYNVIAGSGADLCLRVATPTGGLKAHVVRQSWAEGLALLQVEGTGLDGVPAVSLKSWTQAMPLTGTVAEFARSTGVASEDKVSVISESSSRHFIPGISRVMEIKSAKPYDSSVAGAGFFSGSDLLGLVSHQYLQIHPGSSTRPMRWSPVISGSSNEVSDHLVVIGINDIVKWLQSPVDQDSRLTLPADQSFSPVTTLQSGNLLFTEDCPPLDASVPHDGYPIGGGDPYGIGGDGVTYRACRVSLRLAATPSSLFFNENWRAWHDDMVTVLKNGLQASVEVRFQRDPQTQKPGRDYIYSAESLFQLMKENSGSYLSVAQDPKTGNFGSAASLRNFRSQAELVNAGSRKIYMDLQAGDVRIGELLRQLYLISEVSKSEQWNLLQKQDFTDLLDPQGVHAWAWQAIQQLVAGGPALRVNFEKLFQEWTQLHP